MYRFQHSTDLSKFYVIATAFNPVRFKSRYELYERFKADMDVAKVNMVTVELALGERPFEVTQPGNPFHVQLRTQDEIWHKESALNVALQRLPADWQYVAWIDADVHFARADWAQETVQRLQHHPVVQMFESAIDLGPEGQAIKNHRSFAKAYHLNDVHAQPKASSGGEGFPQHPGYAWAARRDALEATGGLYDTAILGSADHHMAAAIIGRVHDFRPKGIHKAYARNLDVWQDRAKALHKDLGFVEGTLLHWWHGPKADRKYKDRWSILLKHGFDPDRDLQRDTQGLWKLSQRGERLRRDIRLYFHQRNEDSIQGD